MSSRGSTFSSTDTQQTWLPCSAHITCRPIFSKDGLSTPPINKNTSPDNPITSQSTSVTFDRDKDEEQRKLFKQLYLATEPEIARLFGSSGDICSDLEERNVIEENQLAPEKDLVIDQVRDKLPRRHARIINEDNYDDEEEEDDEEEGEGPDAQYSLSHNLTANSLLSLSKTESLIGSDNSSNKQTQVSKEYDQPKSSENARKQLEEVKKATEEAAKRSFHSLFFTLENDRIAMLDQQKLEESEKQIDAEMKHASTASNNTTNVERHGTLSSANLGASSLTLKHLIARIDLKRDQVRASDAELRSLMNEVRKNRSKWASEENIHQEELYEAADKVLSELKAMTEYSAPFLTRVNKRDAPDYSNIIKQPMDLGTMTKKLKTLTYKSKAEFVADLDLIWSNCLKYNADVEHPLRRNANCMKKEAEKLVPLIPDLVIRHRIEVEAEERRKQNGGDDDVGDESDDEPIVSSRGRKTGAKRSKTRKTTCKEENIPGTEQKQTLQLNGSLSNFSHDGSETGIDGSQNGFATPPIGSLTPSNGVPAHVSQSDSMEIDRPIINGLSLTLADDLQEDEEYKIWKQVTKKDRALIAKERNRLFRGDRLNPDEPALLRTKAGMRRWLRQKASVQASTPSQSGTITKAEDISNVVATLSEGMDGEEDRALPDYYDYLSVIPDIPARLQWHEDSEGQLVDRSEDYLRMVPRGLFTAPRSFLTNKFDANMRQMQETRKLCSKIGVIKQMQLQSQTYNNQFSKYEPEPFVEADIEPHVVSDDGPIMSTWVCKSAMQRSVAKVFYAAGFEELQPSALDVITDIAGDYFGKLAQTFELYREAPKVPASGSHAISGARFQERFTDEEIVLHTLSENGLEIETLESYVKDDIERFGIKLSVIHERMKAHLSDLLRPALTDVGADGSGAFKDGSEQFIGGDFAEELGEDFFGFRALGLDSEFGMSTLSVPLHLLHTRLYNSQPSQVVQDPTVDIESLQPLKPITMENVKDQIGLVQGFFLAKLKASSNAPLVEDEDLPVKQRPSRPRLGPTGKINSPRKRHLKEAAGNPKKKKKLENDVAMDPATGIKTGGNPAKGNPLPVLSKKSKPALPNGRPVSMERAEGSRDSQSQIEKDDVSAVGMMSPESIEH